MEELNGRDPLLLYERRLRAEGFLDDALSASLQAEVDEEVAEGERFAAAAPWPDLAEAMAHV
jgi:TPP-dependent pyruvate/acetoin dehydrogenase alpha subunit